MGRVEHRFKKLRALYPERYDRSQLKERIFLGMHPPSMRFHAIFIMKDNVGYEEFLAAVYEAKNEGTEGKVVKLEKVIEEREKSELKDLK